MGFKAQPSALFVALAASTLVLSAASGSGAAEFLESSLLPRDGHGHHHAHGAPLLELNETEVTMYHAPTSPSYWSIDIDDPHDPETPRHPGLMAAHILFMSLAFFVALPAGIALRSVRHSLHGLAVAAFYGFCALGCATSALYSKLTPNMYEGAAHGKQGYLVILCALALSAIDIAQFFLRLVAYVRAGEKFRFKSFWAQVVRGVEAESDIPLAEYHGIISEEPDSIDSVRESSDLNRSHENMQTAQWANEVHRHHHRSYSHTSERTLVSPFHKLSFSRRSTTPKATVPLLKRVGPIAFAVAERILVFAGLMMLITGVVTYTGGCRENYLNGCLAHLIKGGIFWCYGLFTFARFLGTFSELGWAWNRSPRGRPKVTAEMIESLVIFTYGVTNTWMERWGANPGDPYTTKQIQHISIAVMFWFAGLIGIGMESQFVRHLLSQTSEGGYSSMPDSRSGDETEYPWSFNPFPALVIGVTGAAMAAHAQTYQFQVSIHVLWGGLLLGFSAFRFITYFLVWLQPPQATSPSRPPTEALGSFFLACGGLVFMMSTEELTIAAMRRGRDDAMMFLNVAVAVTCFAFCWVFLIVAFKAWLKSRQTPSQSSLSPTA
jgi:zinc transporter ZupT